MTLRDFSGRLAGLQAANGAFRCRIVFRDREEDDCNGFATALVLRHLRRLPVLAGVSEVRRRALDFLERCAAPGLPGAFGFWPADERPAWAQRVPPDVDDTSIITQELALHGRRTLSEVRQVVYAVLMPALVTEVEQPGPPWLRPLVFPTWLGQEPRRANPVDCCVNVNAAALMAWCGLAHLPGYRDGCALLEAGLDWAGDNRARLSSLTPYYPSPVELLHALEHAVESGALELRTARERLRTILALPAPPGQAQDRYRPGVLCGNAYSGPHWYCPGLEVARNFAAGRKNRQSAHQRRRGTLKPGRTAAGASIHQTGGRTPC
jgi:hypothetical protein